MQEARLADEFIIDLSGQQIDNSVNCGEKRDCTMQPSVRMKDRYSAPGILPVPSLKVRKHMI